MWCLLFTFRVWVLFIITQIKTQLIGSLSNTTIGVAVASCSSVYGLVTVSQLVGGEALFTVRAKSEGAVWHLIMPAAHAWWLASLWRTTASRAKRGSHTITWPWCTHWEGLLVISTNHLLQLSMLIITSRTELVLCLNLQYRKTHQI